MARLTLVAPGDLDRISGGYLYDRRLTAALQAAGAPAAALAIPDLYPTPTETALAQAAQLLDATPGALLIDGLAFGVFSAALADRVGDRTLALVHHPLCLERGLAATRREALRASESAALARARGVLTTSAATARDVSDMFGIAPARIFVAEPGVARRSPAPIETRIAAGGPVRLLSVGALIPRKGYDLLLRALAPLDAQLDWRLDVVGSTAADPACAAALAAQAAAAGLQDKIAFRGELRDEALAAAYQRADLYVSAAEHEGFGMAAVDAVAYGLPLVVAGGGALREAAADAAILADWSDAALAAVLARLLGDPAARVAAASRSRAAAERLPRWSQTAEKTLAALDAVLGVRFGGPPR